jgi:hypothetical protein
MVSFTLTSTTFLSFFFSSASGISTIPDPSPSCLPADPGDLDLDLLLELCDDLELLEEDLDFLPWFLAAAGGGGATGLTVMGMMSCEKQSGPMMQD